MRLIGIRHRVKRNQEHEAKPTQVTVFESGKFRDFELADETAEMDFVKGNFPISKRAPREGEDISVFQPHQCDWRKMKKEEKSEDFPKGWSRKNEDKVWEVLTKVPAAFDGLQAGDTVVMVLGGSGDYLAFAMSRRGETIGAIVKRVPPYELKQFRGEEKKDDDASNLIKLFQRSPEIYQDVTPRDRNLIRLRILFVTWQEAMKARMAYEQRLFQWLIGSKFTEETDLYIEGEAKKPFAKKKEDESILESWARGVISMAYEWAKKRDKVLQSLVAEEKSRATALEKHLQTMDVYNRVFSPVEGCGPKISARLIVAIGDVRRFEDTTRPDGKISAGKAKLKSFCGVAVDGNGQFRRRRAGELANWSNDARQALYLIAEQFNRRPESVWGLKLREYKVKLRAAHPDVICKDCSKDGQQVKWENCPDQKHHKRAYNDGHIHKMALWRTATKFVEYLYDEWTRLEHDQQSLPRSPMPKGDQCSSSASAEVRPTA
ncbi:MAG: hypothetical protein NTX82_04885 [Candidatus Parcubacteria bacterium]|nr:hypothetical protein [Candidatus Parcubacteria bacterium]